MSDKERHDNQQSGYSSDEGERGIQQESQDEQKGGTDICEEQGVSDQILEELLLPVKIENDMEICPFLQQVEMNQNNLEALEHHLKLNFDPELTSTVSVSLSILEALEKKADEPKRSKTKEYKIKKQSSLIEEESKSNIVTSRQILKRQSQSFTPQSTPKELMEGSSQDSSSSSSNKSVVETRSKKKKVVDKVKGIFKYLFGKKQDTQEEENKQEQSDQRPQVRQFLRQSFTGHTNAQTNFSDLFFDDASPTPKDELLTQKIIQTKINKDMKLLESAYTRNEWFIILKYSVDSKYTEMKTEDPFENDKISLQKEHLSRQRLKQNFLNGLDKVNCEVHRGEIWKIICKVKSAKRQYSPGLYTRFLSEVNPHGEFKIVRDLFRTLPGNKMFMQPPQTGKNPLFNVLKAYMSYDPQLEYCQGMNYLTAMLLMQIPNEEDVFWCLIFIMYELDWRSIYYQHSPKISLMLLDLEKHLSLHNKEVFQHLDADEAVTMEASFSSQIITCFIYDVPIELATRIFDLFLIEGEQVVVDLLAGMITLKTEKILELEEIDLMNYLKKYIVQDCFNEYSLEQIMPTPEKRVQLSYLKTFQRSL